MKNFKIILMAFIGAVLIWACTKELKDPKLDMSQTIKPVLLSPANGSSFVLMPDSADNTLTTFEWSTTTYSLSDLQTPTYALQMALQGTNFSDPTDLYTGTNTSFPLKVGVLNQKLFDADTSIKGGDTVNVEFRTSAYIADSPDATTVYSDVITLNVVTYASAGPAQKFIYLIGNATSLVPEWDNTVVYKMTPEFKDDGSYKDGIYATVDHLTPGANPTDRTFKFISIPGHWAPQWGTDATGTGDSGPLIYRPTEDEPDPTAIPAPAVEANYYIVADTINLTYETMLTSGELYLVGAATPAGWDNTLAIPFVQDPDTLTKFTLEVNLTAGAGMKFLEVLGEWAPQYGSYDSSPNGGVLSYRRDETITDPPEIPSPDSDGTYTIEVNLTKMAYKFIAK